MTDFEMRSKSERERVNVNKCKYANKLLVAKKCMLTLLVNANFDE